MLYFIKQHVELQAVLYRIQADKRTYHPAAVFHKIESNNRNHEELHDRTGNGKQGFDEIADSFYPIISHFCKGIVDDTFYLIGNIKLGLFIFNLHDNSHALIPQSIEIDCQQIHLLYQRAEDDVGQYGQYKNQDSKRDDDGYVNWYIPLCQPRQSF